MAATFVVQETCAPVVVVEIAWTLVMLSVEGPGLLLTLPASPAQPEIVAKGTRKASNRSSLHKGESQEKGDTGLVRGLFRS